MAGPKGASSGLWRVSGLYSVLIVWLLLPLAVHASTSYDAELPFPAASSGDSVGYSVWLAAFNGSVMAVGAPNRDGSGFSDVNVGAVYVLHKRSNGNWTSTARLTQDSTLLRHANLGYSVCMDKAGRRVLAGAPGNTTSRGYAFVWSGSTVGSSWKLEKQLDPTATTIAEGDSYGASVVLSPDGMLAMVGAPKTDTSHTNDGAAYVFKRSGVTWTHGTKLVASDPASGDYFGNALAMAVTSGAEYTLVLGANGVNKLSSYLVSVGAAYVFTTSTNGNSATQAAKLTASDPASGAALGSSVAINGLATRIALGAPGVNVGSNINQGAVYVFGRTGTTWASNTQLGKLTASDGAASDSFGTSVALSTDGAVLAVGTATELVYVFSYSASSASYYTQTYKITDPLSSTTSSLGYSISLSMNGSALVVGAYGDGQGDAYIYNSAGRWTSTSAPTTRPTKVPTVAPSQLPTIAPTRTPSTMPTVAPTRTPSTPPTKAPSTQPTICPTRQPSKAPSQTPSALPSRTPSRKPSQMPLQGETLSPTPSPTPRPTATPHTNMTVWVRVWDSLGAAASASARQPINVTSTSLSKKGGRNSTRVVSSLLLDAVAQAVAMSQLSQNSTSVLQLVGDIAAGNASVQLLGGDHLSVEMCMLLLGYLAQVVTLDPATIASAVPSLPLAIVNRTQGLVEGVANLTSSRALAASSVLLSTVSGSARAGLLGTALQTQALSAFEGLARRVSEEAAGWEEDSAAGGSHVEASILPSVVKGMSLLIQAGLLNHTSSASSSVSSGATMACTNDSSAAGARASVQSAASLLLDAAVASKVPGEEPVSVQADALGVSAMVTSHDAMLSAAASFTTVSASLHAACSQGPMLSLAPAARHARRAPPPAYPDQAGAPEGGAIQTTTLRLGASSTAS